MSEDLLNVFGSFSEISLDCIEKQNEEIEQLKNNWNELKKWLEDEHKRNINWYENLTHHDKQYCLYEFGATKDVLDNVQDKMQELEGSNE